MKDVIRNLQVGDVVRWARDGSSGVYGRIIARTDHTINVKWSGRVSSGTATYHVDDLYDDEFKSYLIRIWSPKIGFGFQAKTKKKKHSRKAAV